MIEKTDFERLTTMAMRDSGRADMRPAIEKELLRCGFIYTLDAAGRAQISRAVAAAGWWLNRNSRL